MLSIVPSYAHHSPPSWNKPKDCEGDNFFTLIITIISRHTLPSEIPGNPLDPYLSTYSCDTPYHVDQQVDHQVDHHVDHQGDHHGPTLKRWWLCCTPPPPLPPSRPPLPWNDDVFMVMMKMKMMFSNNDISRDAGLHIINPVEFSGSIAASTYWKLRSLHRPLVVHHHNNVKSNGGNGGHHHYNVKSSCRANKNGASPVGRHNWRGQTAVPCYNHHF